MRKTFPQKLKQIIKKTQKKKARHEIRTAILNFAER
jgi:hypothetical protein